MILRGKVVYDKRKWESTVTIADVVDPDTVYVHEEEEKKKESEEKETDERR